MYKTIVSLLFLALVTMAAISPPPLPSSFYGTVAINGEYARVGTRVVAYVDGVPAAYTKVILWNGTSVYSLNVGMPGTTVKFKIGRFWADQSSEWISGTNRNLDLTVNKKVRMIHITEG